jgi:hypothetical protein
MAKTQMEAVLNALIRGRKLTALGCYELTGSLRMSAKAHEIERLYGVQLIKKVIKGKTRYGTPFICTEYSMSRTDAAKVKEKLKSK